MVGLLAMQARFMVIYRQDMEKGVTRSSLLFLAVSFGLVSESCFSPQENDNHLFILSGQSNMVGLDPTISFLPTLETSFGRGTVIVIKDAEGGAPIRRWYQKWKSADGDTPESAGDLYDRLIRKVSAGTKAKEIARGAFCRKGD